MSTYSGPYDLGDGWSWAHDFQFGQFHFDVATIEIYGPEMAVEIPQTAWPKMRRILPLSVEVITAIDAWYERGGVKPDP